MITCTPYIVVDYMTFQNGMMGDIDKFVEELKEAGDAVKVAVDHRWANPNIRFSNIYGAEFAFGLYGHTHLITKQTWYDLSVWDNTGNTSIISGIVPEDISERRDFVKKVLDTSEIFTAGKIHCSDCGKVVNYQEVSRNRYFAGIYCNECWEGKWKAIEAKENYN